LQNSLFNIKRLVAYALNPDYNIKESGDFKMTKRILFTTIIVSLILILGGSGIPGLRHTSSVANLEINTKAELGSKLQMNQTEIMAGAGDKPPILINLANEPVAQTPPCRCDIGW